MTWLALGWVASLALPGAIVMVRSHYQWKRRRTYYLGLVDEIIRRRGAP